MTPLNMLSQAGTAIASIGACRSVRRLDWQSCQRPCGAVVRAMVGAVNDGSTGAYTPPVELALATLANAALDYVGRARSAVCARYRSMVRIVMNGDAMGIAAKTVSRSTTVTRAKTDLGRARARTTQAGAQAQQIIAFGSSAANTSNIGMVSQSEN